jgi:hypothetical protein
MANLTLTKMLFATNVTGPTNPANLQSPDPKENATATGGTTNIDFDMGASVSADTFFAGFISSGVSAIALSTGTGLGTGLASVGSLNLGPTTAARRHAFLKAGSPSSSRYWRLAVTYTGTLSIGIVGIGAAVQPTWGHEWGSGRQPIDLGVAEPLRGGGFVVERAAIKAAWQFTLADLTDVDLKALWAMALSIGISSPVLAMEDPALTGQDMNDALHYGLLARPEVYERLLPGISRWNWRVEEWV